MVRLPVSLGDSSTVKLQYNYRFLVVPHTDTTGSSTCHAAVKNVTGVGPKPVGVGASFYRTEPSVTAKIWLMRGIEPWE